MHIVGIARKCAPDLGRLRISGEDGDAVPAFLPVPNHSIAGLPDGGFRKLLMRRLQLLKADDIGCGLAKPAQQIRQPGANAVDVISEDFHTAYGMRRRTAANASYFS